MNEVGLARNKGTSWLDMLDIEGTITSFACISEILRAKICVLIHQSQSDHLFYHFVISEVIEEWRWNDHKVFLQPWEYSNMWTTYLRWKNCNQPQKSFFLYVKFKLHFYVHTLFHLEILKICFSYLKCTVNTIFDLCLTSSI